MKPLRRQLLLIVAGVLGIGDAVFFSYSQKPIYAPITYVGMDSLMVYVPVSQTGATLKDGKWQPAVSEAQILATVMLANKQPLTLVTLTSSAPFGNLIEAIKNLKAQGKCNVLIRGSDEVGLPPYLVDPRGKNLIIPAIVLCERAMGDAGFHGTLPPDGIVRID